jgi:hypothetical protein
MSTRSDVGLAIKNEAFDSLPDSVKAFLADTDFFETKLSDDEGRLFHVTCIKWCDFEPPISDLYGALDKLEEDDFMILEGCHDYPDSDDGCRGVWDDNPWGLTRNVSVSVDFCA